MRRGRKGAEVTVLVTGMLTGGKLPWTTKLNPQGTAASPEEQVSERLPPGTRKINPLPLTPLDLRVTGD